jgi:hypothetical protein
MEEERPRFTTTEVHGRFYSVREGFLSSASSGQLVPGRKRPALETVLRQIVGGRVQWARAGVDQRGEHWGWATMEDWRQHTEWQAKRLLHLESRVKASESRQQRLEASLEQRERELNRALAELHDEQLRSRDLGQQLQHTNSVLMVTQTAADQREGELRQLRDGLSDSLLGRRLMKRLGLR